MFYETKVIAAFSCLTLSATLLAASAAGASKLDYRYCKDVPPAYTGACEGACYQQRWSDMRDRDKCVDGWAKSNLPASPCRTQEFLETCEAFSKAKCDTRVDPSIKGDWKIGQLNRFVKSIEHIPAAMDAAAKLQGPYAQCLGEAAFKEHKKPCMKKVSAEAVTACARVGESLKRRSFCSKTEPLSGSTR